MMIVCVASSCSIGSLVGFCTVKTLLVVAELLFVCSALGRRSAVVS